MASAEDVIKEQKAKRKAAAQFLNSPPGTEFMEGLEAEFDPDDITGKSVEETYFNLGARHVIRTLKALRKEAQEIK